MTDATISPPPLSLFARRSALAPDTERAFREFGKRVFADGALPGQDQGDHCRRRRPRDAMPLLHPRPHTRCAAARSN